MLSREVMGLFGLAIVWTTAFLMAGAALHTLADLRRLRRKLGAVFEATIVTGSGDHGAFAVQRVEQVGRAVDSGPGVAFFDRTFSSELFGGSLEVGGRTVEVVPAVDVFVWPAREGQVQLARDDGDFESAFAQAKTARGFARVVETPLRSGDKVWVAWPIVSAIDPRGWVARKMNLVWFFIVAEVLAAAACTALALVKPWFGPVSSVGGVLCLAYFLAIQPLGNMVRDAVRTPCQAFLRGEWKRPGKLMR